MLVEDAIEWLADSSFMNSLTLPSNIVNALDDIIDTFANFNFILPVDTFLSCALFTMSFALACGLVKLVAVVR